MSLREKLEKVHAYLINEEHDRAQALFHEAFVEAAREIHKKIMEEEDWVDEDFDPEIPEEIEDEEQELFGEDDLEEMPGDEDEMDYEGDEAAADVEDEMMDDGEAEADMDMDYEEGEGEGGDVEDLLSDVESKIDELRAEFEKLSGEDNGEDTGEEEMDYEEGGEEAVGDEESVEMEMESADEDLEEGDELSTKGPGAKHTGVDDKRGGGSHAAGGGDWNGIYEEDDKELDEDKDEDLDEEKDEDLEEAFDELDESFELENVTGENKHAQIGTGGSEGFSSNEKSPGLQKKLGDRIGGTAVNPNAKGKNHKGYDMESPPSMQEFKKRKNVRNRSTDDQSKVSKEGDSSALINKDTSDGFGAINDKSPIGSKGSVRAKSLTEGKKRAKAKKRVRKSSK